MKEIKALRQKLTVGSDSPLSTQHYPANWQPLLASQTAEQLSPAVLALLSHYQTLVESPTPPAHLAAKPLLPLLDKPPVPEKYHYLLRQLNDSNELFLHCVYLLDSRGYSLPAKFWRKINKELVANLPRTYAPWLAYLHDKQEIYGSITAENWADFYPAARLQALKALRADDPAAFRDVLTQCLEQEKAPERLDILQLFAAGLSLDDVPFLENYQQDRSKKIASLIKDYLLYLDPEKKSEIVGKLRKLITISKKKSKIEINWQHNNTEKIVSYLNVVDVPLFAQSLNLEIKELAFSWNWPKLANCDIKQFIKEVGKHLALADLPRFVRQYFTSHLSAGYFFEQQVINYTDSAEFNAFFGLPITREEKEKIILEILQTNRSPYSDFSRLLTIMQHPFSPESITFSALKNTNIWRKMCKQKTFFDLYPLGFLLPQNVAQEVLAELDQMPELQEFKDQCHSSFVSLKLNAALSMHN